MRKQLEAVKLFHQTYNAPISEVPKSNIPESRSGLRYDLMKEENEEYWEAVGNNDIVEIADALGDMMYILCGTIIEHGLQDKIEVVFDEIQRSNMSKLGVDGLPIYREDGKVLKGPNYSKPDIFKVLSFEEVVENENLKVSFGEAIEMMKKGLRVQRSGWNGKGMYLMIVNSGSYGINANYLRLWKDLNQNQENTDDHVLLPWIGMKTADNKFVPWLASQTDILSDDWQVVK